MPADDSKSQHDPRSAPVPARPLPSPGAAALAVVGMQKRTLRSELRARRKACAPASGSLQARQLGEQVADVLEQAVDWSQVGATAVYAAVGHELDAAPLGQRLRARGIRTCYPRVRSKEPPQLDFVAIADEAELVSAPFGLREPHPDAASVPLSEIDVFVVPGLGFDQHGQRLGQGRSYYDRVLHMHPSALRVGVFHSCQQLSAVPCEPHDEGLDLVVTPTACLVPLARPRHRLQREVASHGPKTPSVLVDSGTVCQPLEVKP